MNSIFKKGKSILKNGLEPYEQGKKNYRDNIPEVEKKALERFNICSGCDSLEEEPIDFLKVKDKRIKEASNKMCGNCGCSITYLIRQDLKVCKKWQE